MLPLPRRALALASFVLVPLLASPEVGRAATAEQSCQDAVAVQGRNYFKRAYRAITACEKRKARGDLDQSVNCRPADGPVTDSRTASALSRARASLSTRLGSRCASADLSAVDLGAPCDQETTVSGLVDCIADSAHGAAAEMLAATVFDATPALSGRDERKCQAWIANEAGRLARVEMTQRRACVRRLLRGGTAGPCPDDRARGHIEKARGGLGQRLASRCTDAVLGGPIDLGFPCDSYEVTTFDRDGATNNNLLSLTDRMVRCVTAAAAAAGQSGAETAHAQSDAPPFSFGVAAGDATDSAFVAWTRVDSAAPVTLEVATDADFTSVVHSEVLTPDAAADNTVKTDVTGLQPATQYYYRFVQGAATSRIGRIRTAPSSGGPVTFAFTGDSNAFFKPFDVLDQIAAADPDVWLYIGDTIYGDDPRSGSGVATVRSEYHAKYRENRSDRALRDLMANVGTLSIWDDHEVTNDFFGTDPGIQAQMAEGNQAFRDYLPIREDAVDPMRLYRSFRWGDAVEFFLIDARQYRSAQADVSEPRCNQGTCDVTGDPCSVQADCDAIQPGQTCIDIAPVLLPSDPACLAEIADPNRTYLGAAQLQWLENGLLNSTAKWKLIMNGPVITSLLFLPYDRWEGYAAERQEILDFVANNSIPNVLFLSTDIHAAIVNDSVSGGPVREIVGGAIGMDTIFRELPPTIAGLIGTLPGLFTSVSYYDIDRFNVVVGTATSSELTLEYRDSSGQVLKQLTIPAAP